MKYIITIIVSLYGFLGIAQYSEIPKKLHSDKAIQDYIQLLSSSEESSLNEKLRSYADSTSTGIAIAIVDKVEDDINYHAAQMLSDWGVGQKGKDNGILILLAYNQRKVAISTGYGVEERLTDALSRRIIENEMIPYFKNKDYYGGLNAGVDAIIQVMQGAYQSSKESFSPFSFFDLLPFIFIVIFILLVFSKRNKGNDNFRGGGGRRGGMDMTDFIILSGLGRSSGGGFGSSGGSFGGGGFGGFGGGMGGGGGASGGW